MYFIHSIPEGSDPPEDPEWFLGASELFRNSRVMADPLRPGRAVIVTDEGHPTTREALMMTEDDMSSLAAIGKDDPEVAERARLISKAVAGAK